MTHPRWAGLVVAGLLLACSSTASETPATDAERQAVRALDAGDPQRAMELFSRAAREADGETRYSGLIGMALCCVRLGEMDRFELIALEAASAAPPTAQAHARLGAMYLKGAERVRDRPAGLRLAHFAVEYLRRAFAVDPERPNVVPNLGLALHLTGQDLAAALMLEEAHRHEPERADVLHHLLVVLRVLERRQRVRELLAPIVEAGRLSRSWRPLWDWCRQGTSER